MKFVGPWTVHGCTVHWRSQHLRLLFTPPKTRENKKKKKKEQNANVVKRESKQRLSIRLDTDENPTFCILRFTFSFFFIFCKECHKWDYALFSGSHALFIGPINIFFNKTFIKNWSQDIHTFKNYFATAFSIFNFQQNKRYSNIP